MGIKLSIKPMQTVGKVKQAKVWTLTQCPACSSKDISTNYFSGEVFCLKCGLVIY